MEPPTQLILLLQEPKMSAKKLGRFTAGLFVAFGLAIGGSFLAAADGSGATAGATTAASSGSMVVLVDIDWH
jgi:hypothetical protein